MNDALDDSELYAFLHHLASCPVCADELEINYIVHRGIGILDEDRGDYNLQKAYRMSLERFDLYLRRKRVLLYVKYIIDTCRFWVVVTAGVLFVRIMIVGA